MLIVFLNKLYKKPQEYQLFWLYILGHIDDGNIAEIPIKKLRKKFKYKSTTFYRILRFGLTFFSNNSSGVYMQMYSKKITIEVIRKKQVKKDITKKSKTIDSKDINVIKIIDYLNQKANKNFTYKNKKSIELINERIKEGFTIDDFKKVIDIKSSKWLNSNMEDFLRPVTLFSNKFESYLNENIKPNNNVSKRFKTTQKAVDKAKSIDWFNQKEK